MLNMKDIVPANSGRRSPPGRITVIAASLLAISLVLGAPISASAAGATKATQIRKMEFFYEGVPITLCGSDRIVDWSVVIRNYLHKEYADGSYDVKMTSYSEFRDDSGVVATSPQTFHSSDNGINTFNVVIKCKDSSETTSSHVGFMLRDGEIINLHLGGSR